MVVAVPPKYAISVTDSRVVEALRTLVRLNPPPLIFAVQGVCPLELAVIQTPLTAKQPEVILMPLAKVEDAVEAPVSAPEDDTVKRFVPSLFCI